MIKLTPTKQVYKLTILMNKDGIEQVEQYIAKSHFPNMIGFIIFLGKRKSPVEAGTSDKAFTKHFNHSIS